MPRLYVMALVVAFLTGGVALPRGAMGNPPLSAVVEFGQPDSGSPFAPTLQHDASSHAKDRPVPRTVVITQGGTVTFLIQARTHGLAIYEPGIEPGDINVGITQPAPPGCPPTPLLDDATGRIAVFDQPCAVGQTTDVVSYTFTDPGRHLFICTFSPHFVDFDMYGWVIVKPAE
jgi:plastocyanin